MISYRDFRLLKESTGPSDSIIADIEKSIDSLFEKLKDTIHQMTVPKRGWVDNLRGKWWNLFYGSKDNPNHPMFRRQPPTAPTASDNENNIWPGESALLNGKMTLHEYKEVNSLFSELEDNIRTAVINETHAYKIDDMIDAYKQNLKQTIKNYVQRVVTSSNQTPDLSRSKFEPMTAPRTFEPREPWTAPGMSPKSPEVPGVPKAPEAPGISPGEAPEVPGVPGEAPEVPGVPSEAPEVPGVPDVSKVSKPRGRPRNKPKPPPEEVVPPEAPKPPEVVPVVPPETPKPPEEVPVVPSEAPKPPEEVPPASEPVVPPGEAPKPPGEAPALDRHKSPEEMSTAEFRTHMTANNRHVADIINGMVIARLRKTPELGADDVSDGMWEGLRTGKIDLKAISDIKKKEYKALAKEEAQKLADDNIGSPPTISPKAVDAGAVDSSPSAASSVDSSPSAAGAAATENTPELPEWMKLISKPGDQSIKKKLGVPRPPDKEASDIDLQKMDSNNFRVYLMYDDPDAAEDYVGKWWLSGNRKEMIKNYKLDASIRHEKKKAGVNGISNESIRYKVEHFKHLLRQEHRPKVLIKEAAKLPLGDRVKLYVKHLRHQLP